MNKFLDDPRFAGIKPFEKKFGDGCIIGLKSRKRPRRLAFWMFSLLKNLGKTS